MVFEKYIDALMQKKGISPLISSVLLVAFVIIIFLVVTSWLQGDIIEETTSRTDEALSGQLDCLSASIDIGGVCMASDGSYVQLNADNVGDSNVDGILIRAMDTATGNLGSVTVTQSTVPYGRILSKSAESSLTTLSVPVSNVNRVEVFPLISGDPCGDQIAVSTNIGSC
jgi:flagellin-like protein